MKQKQSKPAAYFDVPAMNTTAVASQFKQFRTEVADAIRAKKGTTELINPQDFAEEISTISGGGGYDEEQALFDFFEVDLSSDIIAQSQDYYDYIMGYGSDKPWAVKAQGGEFEVGWRMCPTMPWLGHGLSASAVMFQCIKGSISNKDFFGALKPVAASVFYSEVIDVYN